MKRYRKNVKDIIGTSFIAAGGSMALGAIGGSAATSGQAGIASAMRFAPTIGTMAGVGAVFRALPKYKKKKGY